MIEAKATGKRVSVWVMAGLAGLGWISACGDGAVEPAPPPPAPVATTVTVSPGSAALSALGETNRFTAEVRDQNGQVMAGALVAWASSDASVAAVDASGQVTAAANGSATITAMAGSVSGTAAVTVAQVVSAVAVSPAADTLVAFGDTVRLVAEANDANGHGVAGSEFSWLSSDTLVARVDAAGLVESLAEGAVMVTATASDVTGGAELSVVPPLPTTVAVNPDTVAFTALGQTAQLAAEVREQAGRVMAEAPVTWSSGDTLVAVVDSAGLATAVGGGTTTVTAAAGDVSAAVVVTVTQSAGSAVVSPAEASITLGDTLRLAAEAFDENGHAVDGAVFSWSSSDAGAATVDDSGLVTGVAEGTAKITATAGDASGVAEVTVESPDRAALVALYEATDGPNWVDNTNWLTDAPLGAWYGVETDASGRVVGLDLSGHRERVWVSHGLSGTIPPDLANLTYLESLDLQVNGLRGTIPPELGDLANLRSLALGQNSLRGVIPPQLGQLANLESLVLRYNILGGPIPPELGELAKLTRLDLDENELTGPIPSALRGLTSLQALQLRFNSLTGTIPPWLGDLSELRHLTLGPNDLHGPIPPELGNLAKLYTLILDQNNLTGPIPPELGRLTNLGLLFLYANNLTGPIPPELRNLTSLRFLNVWGNNLTGSIPPWLGNLVNLQGLDLADNQLTGQVPVELGSLHQLRDISLSGNQLTGSLPLSFAQLNNMESLGCQGTEGVCLPSTDAFREWARQVEARGNVAYPVNIPWCDEIDKQALEALYEAASGWRWARSDGWLTDEDLRRWHGVTTDSIGRVSELDLAGNGLSGHVPDALRLLAGLTELRIGDNALVGRLPLSLVGLPLEEFDYDGTSLCTADDPVFREWVNGIPRHIGTGVQCPPLTDRDVLEQLYRSADGRYWNQSAGWLTDVPLAQWQGVETDAAGQVVGLRLRGYGLSGSLPAELGQLSELRELDLSYNDLSGSIPQELGDLANLTRLHLGGNGLGGEIPAVLGQLSGLRQLSLFANELSGSIPPELGDLADLYWLELAENELTGPIPVELGNLAKLIDLRLNDNLLSDRVPHELGGLTRLEVLDLANNGLSGSIPSELGRLGAVETLSLSGNLLSGRIPQQLGALDRLASLDLSGNQLSGPIPLGIGGLGSLQRLRIADNVLTSAIPAELGSLADLTMLELADNQLSGSIPAELGSLTNLDTLHLGNNQLSGPLPSELGAASALESLDLRSNALAGPVPSEFANLRLLKSLIVADNPDLAGPLPADITALNRLEQFMAGGTELCLPSDPVHDDWFSGIARRLLARCPDGLAIYLTQAVQSWDHPVPLLAGEPVLLRVFVTAAKESAATMPPVRTTFYLNGVERHTADIAAVAKPIPTDINEGDLALSANAEIPDWVIAPGLEMVIEVDPEGTLDPSLGVTKRIPDSGRLAVDVRAVPDFHLTLIPFLLAENPDWSAVDDVSAMAANPGSHELLSDVRTLLPIAGFEVTAREPVMVSTPDIRNILRQVEAMRLMEGGSGYWMGISDGRLKPGSYSTAIGVAIRDAHASASIRNASVIAHELGHNLSLQHAPCGSPDGVDPWFPHAYGSIGTWGYDFGRRALVAPDASDIMSYCRNNKLWISDYFFNKALDHRLARDDATTGALAAVADPVRTLLLWGGRDQDGVPFLDPAFVVDAVPALPPPGTEYAIEGTDPDGTLLFSYSFDMPVTADGEGEQAGFVFALPVQMGWEDDLASITLSGRGGVVVLDETTDQPMAILRDPRTGQVRAFLRDLPPATQTAADAIGRVPGQGLETLFSRGIPGAEAWRR